MAIKFAVLAMIFTPLLTVLGAIGIGRLKTLLSRVATDHSHSR